jgi:hypothetical protein
MNMILPTEIQQICANYLEIVRHNPEHNLHARDRFAIYKSFGLSKLSRPEYAGTNSNYLDFLKNEVALWKVSDYAFGWLAVLTVRRVLFKWEPIWKQNNISREYTTTPQMILQVAEGVLLHSVGLEEAYRELCNEFSMGSSVTVGVMFDIKQVYTAAYWALESILDYDVKYLENAPLDAYILGDFAFAAMQAYSYVNEANQGQEILFDSQKRLEFWEWWITEAIPQAWDLGMDGSTRN